MIPATLCTRQKQHCIAVLARKSHHFFLLLEDLAGSEAPVDDASWAASAFAILELLLVTAVDGPVDGPASSTTSALTLRFLLEGRSADGPS